MPTFLSEYSRTVSAAAVIVLLLLFTYGGWMDSVYPGLLGVFEWLETTPFGYIGKTWGAAFAFVEAIHLIGLAVLGGCVIASDGRLLNLVLTDVPAQTVFDRTHRVFVWALVQDAGTGGGHVVPFLYPQAPVGTRPFAVEPGGHAPGRHCINPGVVPGGSYGSLDRV